MITGKNHIGNQLSAEGSKTFKTFDPISNIENSSIHYEASQKEINEAVSLASDAFKEFRTISGERKAAFLHAIADEILALDDELIQTIVPKLDCQKDEQKEKEEEQFFNSVLLQIWSQKVHG